MLELRKNVPPPVPEPLTPEAIAALFVRIRAELGLQGVDANEAAEYARKASVTAWPRATDADCQHI